MPELSEARQSFERSISIWRSSLTAEQIEYMRCLLELAFQEGSREGIATCIELMTGTKEEKANAKV